MLPLTSPSQVSRCMRPRAICRKVEKRDAEEFLPLAASIPIVPVVQEFCMQEANEALVLLKEGRMRGAGVLRVIGRDGIHG